MTRLAFHREVYAGEAVDEAVKVFAKHAAFELTETDDHWVVEVTANKPAAERRLVGELCNYALGLTAERRGTR